jgi:hypothetical protein
MQAGEPVSGVGDLTLMAAGDCPTPARGFFMEASTVPTQALQSLCFV